MDNYLKRPSARWRKERSSRRLLRQGFPSREISTAIHPPLRAKNQQRRAVWQKSFFVESGQGIKLT